MGTITMSLWRKQQHSQISAMVNSATDELHLGPDWQGNLSICDALQSASNQDIKDCIASITNRLKNKSANVQLLTLQLLHAIVQNVGVSNRSVAQAVASRDLLRQVSLLATPEAQRNVFRRTFKAPRCAVSAQASGSLNLDDNQTRMRKVDEVQLRSQSLIRSCAEGTSA